MKKTLQLAAIAFLLTPATAFPQSNCMGYFIRFPDDLHTEICSPVSSEDYGVPQILGAECDSLSITFQDIPEDFSTSQFGECYEFDRMWTIYNPATFNAALPCTLVPNPRPATLGNDPSNFPGPVVSAPGTILAGWEPTIVKIVPTDPDPSNYSMFWSENANCYQFAQKIRIFDSTPPFCATTALEEIQDTTPNDLRYWELVPWTSSTGSHRLTEAPVDFELLTEDNCPGNDISFRFELFLDLDDNGVRETQIFSDQPPPFGYVKFNNMNIPSGTDSRFDDRPVPPEQRWGFGIEVNNDDPILSTARFVWYNQLGETTIPQLSPGSHRIKWFATDACGNETITIHDFNITFIPADSLVSCSGRVVLACGEPLPGAKVSQGNTIVTCDPAGKYTFNDIATGTDIQLCPIGPNNQEYATGVNVCDMYKVSQHILGLEPLPITSIFQSDVNQSASITTFDVLYMRKMLFGLCDMNLHLPPPQRWSFLNANLNPGGVATYCYSYPNVQYSLVNADFQALKTGDADRSFGCENGDKLPFNFTISDRNYAIGDTVIAEFTPEFPIEAFQGVIQVDNFLIDEALNENFYQTGDKLKMTWLKSEGMPIKIHLLATQDGPLAGNIHFIEDDYTKNIIHSDSCIGIEPTIDYVTVSTTTPAKEISFSASPNPWGDKLQLNFTSTQSTEGTIALYDIAGKLLFQNTVKTISGKNSIGIPGEYIQASGIILCRLMLDNQVYTIKTVKE